MIAVNELRIGNYVIDNNEGIVRVETITENGINISLPDCLFEIDGNRLEAIHLTKEIVLKCGFEVQKMYDCEQGEISVYHNEDIGYISNSFAYCINASNEYSEYDNIVELSEPITSVHQLQNLYFALTGKELIAQL